MDLASPEDRRRYSLVSSRKNEGSRLTQQVQITVELYPTSSIFSAAAGAAGSPPTQLSTAEFQVQQIIFENQGDALARRVDMTSHALNILGAVAA
jgi:hypothetical protein